MKSKDKEERQKRNKDIVERMRNGDQLSSFKAESSWFPPRSIIKKDEKALQFLYDKKAKCPKCNQTFSMYSPKCVTCGLCVEHCCKCRDAKQT